MSFRGLEDGKLVKTKSGAIMFGLTVRPHFEPVEVSIRIDGTRFLALPEGGEQVEALGIVELEVLDDTTIWVTAMECRADRVRVSVRHGWLRKDMEVRVVEHAV